MKSLWPPWIVLGVLAIFRLLAAIPIPGIDAAQLQVFFNSNQFIGLLNLFSGGGLANLSLVLLGVVASVLDRLEARHCVGDLEERVERIAVADRERVLERDQRQVRRIRDRLEVADRHLGPRIAAAQAIAPARD